MVRVRRPRTAAMKANGTVIKPAHEASAPKPFIAAFVSEQQSLLSSVVAKFALHNMNTTPTTTTVINADMMDCIPASTAPSSSELSSILDSSSDAGSPPSSSGEVEPKSSLIPATNTTANIDLSHNSDLNRSVRKSTHSIYTILRRAGTIQDPKYVIGVTKQFADGIPGETREHTVPVMKVHRYGIAYWQIEKLEHELFRQQELADKLNPRKRRRRPHAISIDDKRVTRAASKRLKK